MHESEMVIIPQKQSFWWKIGGWLPVVIISGIFFSIAYVLQSIPHTPSPASTGTGDVSDGVPWTSWVPLGTAMLFVAIVITMAVLKREAIKIYMEWKVREQESKKWFWYIIVLIITITFSSVSPDEHRYTVAMITALLGLHVVWLVLLREKTVSATTKVVVTGFLIFFIAAGLLPGTSTYLDAKWRVIKKDVAIKSEEEKNYADAYDGKSASEIRESSQQSARRAPQAVLKTTTQTLHLEPGRNNFRKVGIPSGTRVIESVEWSCEDGCIIEVEHDMNRLCEIGGDTEHESGLLWSLGTYQETKCRVATIPSRPGVIRYREQFLAPIGADNNNFLIPDNLIHVITSFGTNEVMGPRDIVVSAITSS